MKSLLTCLAAIGVTAIALVAGTAFAHVLEVPHKLAMAALEWHAVQSVLYDGWGRQLLRLELLAATCLAIVAWCAPPTRPFLGITLALMVLAEGIVFLVWIAPTNAAVDGWGGGRALADWAALRANWEWGHAGRAAITAAAVMSAVLAVGRIGSQESRAA